MRVILDTDPGNGIPGADIDDGLAIALAVTSPEVDLEAVTVVAGNVPVDDGVDCALEALEAAGASGVPVHRGADRPLVSDPASWRAVLDGRREDPVAKDLWRGVHRKRPTARVDPTPAAQTLVDRVNQRPGEITVVAVGPLTNVATAMLLDREWPDKVERLVMMGGAFDVPNVLQELNVAYDAEASHIVFSSSVPLTVVPLDVTLRTAMTLGDVDRLAAGRTPLSIYLAETVRPWVAWLGERLGRDGCPLHDPLAVATLVDPSLVTMRSAAVGIELHGTLTRGRTVAWDPSEEMRPGTLRLPDVRQASIAVGVDNQRFMALLMQRLVG